MAFMKRLLCLHCGARPAPALELLPFPHLNGVRHNGQGVLCPLPLPTPSCSQFPAPSACSSCCCCCCSFSHFLFPLPAPLFSLSLLPCLPLLLLLPCSTSLPVVWHAPLPLSSLSHASVNLPSSSLSLSLCFCFPCLLIAFVISSVCPNSSTSETFYASIGSKREACHAPHSFSPPPPLPTATSCAASAGHFDSNGKRKRKFRAHAFSFFVLTTAGDVERGEGGACRGCGSRVDTHVCVRVRVVAICGLD